MLVFLEYLLASLHTDPVMRLVSIVYRMMESIRACMLDRIHLDKSSLYDNKKGVPLEPGAVFV